MNYLTECDVTCQCHFQAHYFKKFITSEAAKNIKVGSRSLLLSYAVYHAPLIKKGWGNKRSEAPLKCTKLQT